jgi:hypothetical protein
MIRKPHVLISNSALAATSCAEMYAPPASPSRKFVRLICFIRLVHPTFPEFVENAAVSRVSPFHDRAIDSTIHSSILSLAQWIFTMGLVASSILDVVITLCLIWYLDRARTGFAG